MKTQKQKSILFVKIAGIGDVVMSLPAFHALQDRGKVTWVVGKSAKQLVKALTDVENVIVIDDRKLLFGSFFQKVWVVLSLYLKIGGRKFDEIYIGHVDKRYHFLTFFTQRGRQSSFKDFKLSQEVYMPLEYMKLIGEKTEGLGNLNWPRLSLPRLSVPYSDIILAPGGSPKVEPGKNLRMWPITNYVSLAENLINKGYYVSIIGSKSDQWMLNYFSHLKITNFCGMYSLPEVLSIMKKAKAIVTHDSGPMHMGVLAGIHVFSIFGPTNPKHFTPENERVHVFWEGKKLNCCPCYDGKSYAKCFDSLCTKKTTPELVFEKICETI